jgi:hypothetical protein
MRVARFAIFGGLTMLASPAPAHAQGAEPCALLTTAEVTQAFPGTKAGRPDRDLEKYGQKVCRWDYPGGELTILISTDGAPEHVREEAEAMADVILDPLRSDGSRHVRYEALPGVGDEALAIVEREDPSKGFKTAAAILVVRRGKRVAALLSTDLARKDRAVAFKVLSDLGKALAKRLG